MTTKTHNVWRNTSLVLLLIVCLPSGGGLMAQDDVAARSSRDRLADFGFRTQGPSLSSDLLSEDSGVEITVGEEGEQAALKLAVDVGAHDLSIILSSPVDKDAGRADFFGFDGFNSEAAVKLGYTYKWWPKVDAPPQDTSLRDLQNCLAVLEVVQNYDRLVRWRGGWTPALLEMAKAVRGKTIPSAAQVMSYHAQPDKYIGYTKEQLKQEPAKTEATLWVWLANLEAGFTAGTGTLCSDDSLYEAEIHLGIKTGLVERRLAAGKKTTFLTLEGTAGRKTFKYFDPSTLEAASTREQPNSFGLTFGWGFLSRDLAALNNSIAFSVKIENGYKAQDAVQVCETRESPVDGKTVESCSSMALGAPGDVDSDFLGFEWRFLGRKIGTGVRAFYRGIDAKSDDFGLEIPLYFLQTDENKLSGGVRLGWSDQEGETTLTIFAAKAFDSLVPGG